MTDFRFCSARKDAEFFPVFITRRICHFLYKFHFLIFGKIQIRKNRIGNFLCPDVHILFFNLKKSRQFFNIFVVWFLTGFWHGAAWNFIFWGLYFFVLLMIEKSFLLKHLEKSKVLSHVYLIFFIIISWGIFALSDLSKMGALFSRMFSLHGGTDWMYYLRDYAAMFVLCILASTPFFKKLADSAVGKNRVVRTVFLAGVLVVCVAFMVDSTYSPFLYFNF